MSKRPAPAKTKPMNAFYAQSGGVTAVINASACGVIETARSTGPHRQRLRRPQRHHRRADRGPDRHQQGIGATIAALRSTPSGAFGSCRYKLKSLEKNRREYERLIEVFKAHDIGYFFYNGGGDSADTCFKVTPAVAIAGLSAAGDPRAEDRSTTTCRSPTAARASARSRSTWPCRRSKPRSTCARWRRPRPRCSCIEVMGRHAGWIAAAGGLAAEPRASGRHPVSRDRVRRGEVPRPRRRAGEVARLLHRRRVRRRHHADGTFLAEQGTQGRLRPRTARRRAPVVANMVKEALGYKFHWAVADYLQRAARHIASKTDVKQAYELGQGGGRTRAEGPQRGDADHRAHSDVPYD